MEKRQNRKPSVYHARAQAAQMQNRRERLVTQALLAAVLVAGALILGKLDIPAAGQWRTRISAALAGDRAEDAVAAFRSLSQQFHGGNGNDPEETQNNNETSDQNGTQKKVQPPETPAQSNS